MTLDVIACCALGIEVKTLKNPDHIILEKCRELFTGIEDRTGPLRYVFGIASESLISAVISSLHRDA